MDRQGRLPRSTKTRCYRHLHLRRCHSLHDPPESSSIHLFGLSGWCTHHRRIWANCTASLDDDTWPFQVIVLLPRQIWHPFLSGCYTVQWFDLFGKFWFILFCSALSTNILFLGHGLSVLLPCYFGNFQLCRSDIWKCHYSWHCQLVVHARGKVVAQGSSHQRAGEQ